MSLDATHYVRSTPPEDAVVTVFREQIIPRARPLGSTNRGAGNASRPRPTRDRAPLLFLLGALGLFFAFDPNRAIAQAIKLSRPRPRPELSLFSTLSVSASPTSVSFTLVSGGTANASSSIVITTSYTNGIGVISTVTLYGYFSSAANALTGGTPSASIPSSDVYGVVPGGGAATSYTAFTQTTPYGTASGLELTTETAGLTGNGSFSGTLSLQIRLAATPQVPAATYTGTLTLEAQAN